MADQRRNTHLLCGQIYVGEEGAGPDRLIAGLATRQHGVVSRRQLLALGVTDRMIEHRLALGSLRSIHPGVHAAGHGALPYPAKVAAAVLAVTGEAVASHMTSLALRRMVAQRPGIVHVTATQPRTRRRGVAIHRAVLPDGEVEIVDGIPATSVARTLLDLSGPCDRRGLRRLVKEAEFQGVVDFRELEEILERYPRRRGRRTLAEIVRAYAPTGRTRSELEDRFLALCAAEHLPMPQTNVALQVAGEQLEVDCLWADARLIVELDGWQAHGRESAFHDDRARDRALVAGGYRPMRITWTQLDRDGSAIAAEIRAALRPRT